MSNSKYLLRVQDRIYGYNDLQILRTVVKEDQPVEYEIFEQVEGLIREYKKIVVDMGAKCS